MKRVILLSLGLVLLFALQTSATPIGDVPENPSHMVNDAHQSEVMPELFGTEHQDIQISPELTGDINMAGFPVPEPNTLLLLGAGLLLLSGRLRKKIK